MKRLNTKIVILSRGRSDSITTHKLLPSFVPVVVPYSEVDLYKEVLDNPVIPIPDEIEGLGKVRNWCLNNFNEETIIMCDDDLIALRNISNIKVYNVKKERILDVIINTSIMAKDSGAKVFGFSQSSRPRQYNPTEPFKLCSFVGGVIGVIGRQLYFRDDKFKVDIDFCLQNLLVNRILWQDARYTFAQVRNKNSGGNSLFRTKENYDKSLQTLKEKWGKYLRISKNRPSDADYKLSIQVQRKQRLTI